MAVVPAASTGEAATAPVVARKRRGSAKRSVTRATVVARRTASILIFFALWYAASLANAHLLRLFNPVLLPSPDEVLKAGIAMAMSGELARHILASLSRVV